MLPSHLKRPYNIQIVDVFKSFDMALDNGIFLTPALIKVSPPPRTTIFGDLSDKRHVLKVLRLGNE
jgi:hypothetical protein